MFKLSAGLLPLLYGIITYSSFGITLFLACYLHFKQVTKNHCRHWEFLPSISATIGDFTPEMNVFRYGMALTSGLRLGTIYLNHYLAVDEKNNLISQLHNTNRPNSFKGTTESLNASIKSITTLIPLCTIFDTLRVFSAGVWIYVSSSEWLFFHQCGFVSYVIFSFLYMYTYTSLFYQTRIKFKVQHTTFWSLIFKSYDRKTQKELFSLKWKVIVGITHFLLFISSLKYFVDHEFHCVYLAYSKYSVFEWSLAIFNVGYDILTYFDLDSLYFTLHREKVL
ncbi:S60 ribosomal protein L12 [Tieghemostelium lacteum]|uniref:S60 ribosomal protein L12 n=1 Tax=Tieghemostelium lacteum TaxID=361077 RepID=A0A152A1P1_TIELA|nr:S60 ribosomal protein L12 [Tieghemostelium lacteum]|eukprot:KYR00173.1 S60 ribosomal protein L12 [Tieghemostelium lacteum]